MLHSVPRALKLPALSANAFAHWHTAGDALTRSWALRRAFALKADGVTSDALLALTAALARPESTEQDRSDAASTHPRVGALWALELAPFIDSAAAFIACAKHVAATCELLYLLEEAHEDGFPAWAHETELTLRELPLAADLREPLIRAAGAGILLPAEAERAALAHDRPALEALLARKDGPATTHPHPAVVTLKAPFHANELEALVESNAHVILTFEALRLLVTESDTGSFFMTELSTSTSAWIHAQELETQRFRSLFSSQSAIAATA